MKRFSILFLLFILIFYASCTPELPATIVVDKIFSLEGSLNRTDLDYPYIYIAADTDGFWRIDLSDNSYDALELRLLDPLENILKANYIDAHGNDVIALTEGDVWRSISSGTVWYSSDIGIERMFSPKALSRSSTDPRKLFLINNGDAIYYSLNWGESWQKGIDIGIEDYNNSYWDPYNGGNIWIDGINGSQEQFVMCVENYGNTQKNISIPAYDEAEWFSSLEFFGSGIYMRTSESSGKHVMKSENGGTTWSEIETDYPDSIEINRFFNDPSHTGTFYLTDSDNEYIYRSTDTLKTFSEFIPLDFDNENEYIHTIYYEPMISSLILVTHYGIYVVSLE